MFDLLPRDRINSVFDESRMRSDQIVKCELFDPTEITVLERNEKQNHRQIQVSPTSQTESRPFYSKADLALAGFAVAVRGRAVATRLAVRAGVRGRTVAARVAVSGRRVAMRAGVGTVGSRSPSTRGDGRQLDGQRVGTAALDARGRVLLLQHVVTHDNSIFPLIVFRSKS
jgi:hypothetical protein